MLPGPDAVSDLAERLQARGPGRVTLSAGTHRILVDALRAFSRALARPRVDAAYTVRAWSGHLDDAGEDVAVASKYEAARGAYDAMCAAHPTYMVSLSQGGRMMSMQRGGTVRI